ncbi:hypothetical protein EYR41_008858 [Orbilia oligospora]|uniref:Clr5 domain-containing protein n=1 Tax=Orbilia oligospora TaxID=2813651 RepID=A0A8H2HMP4_ORBOL|nr:hypothetical protein EYR41_008858 [Orbilia oligospora]
MDDGIFQTWPQKPKCQRYLKLKNIADHKDFIVSLRRAGVKQQAILDALRKEKGVELPIYKLKRMLDKWGVSNNNLTKKCEKDIRQRIEERKLFGKKARRVVMNRSGKSLSPEKLNTIMAAGPTYFKGVKLSPQRSVVVFSTPTPRGGCERNCEGSIELSRNMEQENGCAEPLPSEPRLSFEDPDRLGRLQADDLEADNNEVFSSGDTGVHMILRISNDDFMESGGEEAAERKAINNFGEGIRHPENMIEILVNLGQESQDTLISSVREKPALRSESQVSVEEIRDKISSGLANILQVEMIEARPAGYMSYPENIWISAEDKDGRTPTAEGATESVDDIQDDTPLGKYARQTRQAFWDELKSWKKQAMEFVEGVGSISKERGISLLKAGDIVSMEWERRGCVGNLPYHIYKQILDMDEGAKSVPTAEVDGVNRELLWQAIEENFAALKRVLEQFPSNHYHWESLDGFTVHIPFVLANIGMITHEMALDSLDWIPELWMEPELVQVHNRAFKNMTTMTFQKYGQSHPKTLRLLSKMARDFLDSGQVQRHRPPPIIGANKKITQIMDMRGPILYFDLGAAFDSLSENLRRVEKTEGLAYRELYKAMKRSGIDTQEYIDILTVRSAERSRTPDLQDFMYTKGLESWLAHQDIPFGTNSGGFVGDIDYANGLEFMVVD